MSPLTPSAFASASLVELFLAVPPGDASETLEESTGKTSAAAHTVSSCSVMVMSVRFPFSSAADPGGTPGTYWLRRISRIGNEQAHIGQA